MSYANIVPAAAVTANGNSATVGVPASLDGVARRHSAASIDLSVNVSAASGTTPTLALTVQWSNDGVTWFTADGTADGFASITAAITTTKNFPVRAELYRVAWVVGGTTPSFTFAIDAHWIP